MDENQKLKGKNNKSRDKTAKYTKKHGKYHL